MRNSIKIKKLSNLKCSDIFLLRWPIFGHGNGLSGNRMILQSLVLSIILSGAYFTLFKYLENGQFQEPPHPFSIFFALFTGFFINERLNYYQKWKYLANLYNDILKAPHFNEERSSFETHYYRDSLEGAFVMDCLQLGMWKHPSFCIVVYNYLEKSINRMKSVSSLENIDFETAYNLALAQQLHDLEQESKSKDDCHSLSEVS